MEVLKASLRQDSSHSGQQQQLLTEESSWVVERWSLSGEGFSVDDLLNLGEFAENEAEEAEVDEAGKELKTEAEARGKETEKSGTDSSPSSSASGLTVELQAPLPPPPPPLSDICLPGRDAVEELEWMSMIMDDSISEIPPPCSYAPPFILPLGDAQKEKRQAGVFVSQRQDSRPSFGPAVCALSTEAMVPVKAKRSNRSRGVTAAWSMSGPLPFADSSSSISSASSCSSTSSSPPCLIYDPSAGADEESFLLYSQPSPPPLPPLLTKKHKPKKRGRKPKILPTASGPSGERRCSHCGVQKTPQWRAGPLGAKTLCNACGVRFKSGRLLPEYRPACSPTFVSHIHSNSHRKVLEMRRKKETEIHTAAAPPVASF
ncbi:GATA transcription factor 5-like [Curcuma longa]|uniref:GATA transcription factor 5-like n=1 Tax=Curcuma longa TaxID=136217 RepID=UPI003D9DF8B0